MKIALCDDDEFELEKTQMFLDEFISSKQANNQITVTSFKNGNDLLDYINKHGCFDFLILDIIMPGLSSIELAAEIRSTNSFCKIVFLTSSAEFAIHSYKVNALNYLLKPFSDQELYSLLNKALDEMVEEKSTSIVIKEKSKLTRIQIHTIQYVEIIRHNITFHLQNNKTITCYGSLNEYQDVLLADARFVQCHRSYIVNLNYVISILNKDIIIDGNALVPISKLVFQHVKEAYINYIFHRENGGI